MISADIPLQFVCYRTNKKKMCVLWRCASNSCTILFLVDLVYFFVAELSLLLYDPLIDLKIGLAFMSIYFIAFALWLSFQWLEKRIVKLGRKMEHFQTKRRVIGKSPSIHEICWLILLTLFPFMYAAMSVLLVSVKLDTFYSLGYQLDNQFHEYIVNFAGLYGYFWISKKWIFVTLWFVCHLLYEGVCILRDYNDRLSAELVHSKKRFEPPPVINPHSTNMSCKSWAVPLHNTKGGREPKKPSNSTTSRKKVSTEQFRETLMEYFDMVKIIQELRDIISLPSLLLIMMSFTVLYTFFSNALLGLGDGDTVIEMVFFAPTGCVVLISLSFLGTKIPQSMSDIKITCSRIIEGRRFHKDSEEHFLLERIEKIESVYITACDFIVLTKSFILTSLGSLLTFGLLIFNMKTEKEKQG